LRDKNTPALAITRRLSCAASGAVATHYCSFFRHFWEHFWLTTTNNGIFFFQRRTSREGLLSEAAPSTASELQDSLQQLSEGTSSDPLLQIPSELSAVLTLKRGVHLMGPRRSPKQNSNSSDSAGVGGNRTPLLKRKRESIV
jgi:hypothetical protein